MRWRWESSHYRKELGDLLLDRIFDYRDPQSAVTWRWMDIGVVTPAEFLARYGTSSRVDR